MPFNFKIAPRLLALITIGLLVAGCQQQPWGWKQAAPIAPRHHVSTIAGLELMLIDTNNGYTFDVQCTASARYRDITVAITGAPTVQQASMVPQQPHSVSTTNIADCTPDRWSIMHGEFMPARFGSPGDEIEINFEARGGPHDSPGEKIMTIFTIGDDGKLRAGSGTVWR